MNNDREMFRRLVETARRVQAAHIDSLHSETRRRAGPGIVPAAALLGITVLLVVATIAALSAARNFPSDSRVAQTDTIATPRPPTIAPATPPTATAMRNNTVAVAPSPTATTEPTLAVAPAETATREAPPAAASSTPTAVKCPEPTKAQLGVTGASATNPKLSFEQMSTAADLILIGTVERIDAPRWNTVDGCYEEWNDVGITLYKPVRLDVGRVLTDKVGVPSDVEYALFDGRLGDIGQRGAEDPPQLLKGRRYLFFSRPSLNRQTEQDTGLMILEQEYPIDDRNRVIVGPGDVRPLERTVEDILRVAQMVEVYVQCGGEGRESVTIINQTDREITVSSISGSHYDRERNRVVTHDEAELNITLDPGEKHTHRPSARTFFSGHSEGEHSYESALVVTSFGSAAVRCGNSTSFTEGQRIQQKGPASVTFRLTLDGEAPQAESFDLLGSREGSHDMVLTGVFCGKVITGPEAISKAPCEGSGKVYTIGPFEYFAIGDRIDFSIRRRGDGEKLDTVLQGPMELTERDTVIDAQYDFP